MKITIRNQEFVVESNYDHTLLKTEVEGQEIAASTLPLLVKDITKLLEVPKAAIPVMTMITPDSWQNKTGKIQFRSGVLTSIHAGNNNLIIKWDGSKSASQTNGGYGTEVLQKLTPEQQAEFQKLFDAKKAAHEAWDRLRRKYSINETEGRRLIKEFHKGQETAPATPARKPLKLK